MKKSFTDSRESHTNKLIKLIDPRSRVNSIRKCGVVVFPVENSFKTLKRYITLQTVGFDYNLNCVIQSLKD